MNSKKIKEIKLREGNLKEIAEILLVPILNARPTNFSLKAWLEHMLHTEEREIRKYVTHVSFKMPGLYKAAAFIAVQGYGERQIKKGTILWVRTDETQLDIIDVEVCLGQGKESPVFQLDRSEWVQIVPNIAWDRTKLR